MQKFPCDLLPSTFCSPENEDEVHGRSELERRRKYLDVLEGMVGFLLPPLVLVIKQCLRNSPHQRPSTDELLVTLQRMKVEVEGEYGGEPIKLDLVRVRLAKEVKELRKEQVARNS